MKIRYLLHGLAICVIVGLAIFGRVKGNSYTDLRKEENYIEQLMVAELPEEIAIDACGDMLEDLPNSPIILRVIPTEEMEHLFRTGRQKVTIEEIYAGEDLEIGEDIYLYFNTGSLILGEDDVKSIELSFVNVMKKGSEYLVFLSHKVDALKESIPVYQLNKNFISPIFSYDDPKARVILPFGEDHTYVPYVEVKENEFFGETEKAFEAWENLKSEMLLAYPK